MTSLSQKMSDAQSEGSEDSKLSSLKDIFGKISGGSNGDKMDEGEQLKAEAKAYNFNPDDVAPPDVQEKLLELLKWRDSVYRVILKKIESIPGLSDLLEQLTNALNACLCLFHLGGCSEKSDSFFCGPCRCVYYSGALAYSKFIYFRISSSRDLNRSSL